VLWTSAHLFARDVEAVAAKFIAHAMPETFVADLKGALDIYEQALRSRETGKGESAAARASIETVRNSGLAAARKLDVILANLVRDDVIVLVEWERNRRVDNLRGNKTETPTATPTARPSPSVVASFSVPKFPAA